MATLILLNKPFQVLSQFSKSDSSDKATLADHIDIPNVYPAGRLDYDSEGLMLLTDNGALQNRIAHPDHKTFKSYWVQVEGIPNVASLEKLQTGLMLKDGLTKPAKASIIAEPNIWPRTPPIRERKEIPTTWLEIEISEGRNRQVRRMTAAIGHPTLRLIRHRIGEWTLDHLQPGQFKVIDVPTPTSPQRTRKPMRTSNDSARTKRNAPSRAFNDNRKSGNISPRKRR